MKKRISVMILLLLLISSTMTFADDINSFNDINPQDWYKDTVSYLVNIGGISGYPDGSFKPNQTMTKAEFIKTLISSLGYSDIEKMQSHWASGYIEQGVKLNIIENGWLKNIDKPISRYEMARIISNTLTYRMETIPSNITEYKALITDFNKIPSTLNGETNGKTLSECVLETFVKGIVTGYPNGSFEGGQSLTRAEASTVIVRVLNNNLRVTPDLGKIISFDEEILRLVNIERNKQGVKPLVLSSELSRVALLKSEDMAVFDYFDHTSPNYGSPFEMMSTMGISYKAAGENIAKGYKTAESVVKGWMNSPGHRANILSPLFGRMGIGYYESNTTYWTQMFIN